MEVGQTLCLKAICIALYCTVLYCTALYCTVQYCTVLYCTVLYCTVLYCIDIILEVLCHVTRETGNARIFFSAEHLIVVITSTLL